MEKLKMFAGSLLCALDHSELRFCREFSRMNDIMKPCDFCPVNPCDENFYFIFQVKILQRQNLTKTFGEVVKDAKSTHRQVYKSNIIEIFLLLPNQGLIFELFPMGIIPQL